MTQVQIQSQIDAIKNQLIEKYKPEKIFLFGSSVTGKMNNDSDLDFLIIKDDKKKPYNRIVEVYGLIKKDIAADFIVYTPQELAERVKLGDPFIASILSEGKILYGYNQGTRYPDFIISVDKSDTEKALEVTEEVASFVKLKLQA